MIWQLYVKPEVLLVRLCGIKELRNEGNCGLKGTNFEGGTINQFTSVWIAYRKEIDKIHVSRQVDPR